MKNQIAIKKHGVSLLSLLAVTGLSADCLTAQTATEAAPAPASPAPAAVAPGTAAPLPAAPQTEYEKAMAAANDILNVQRWQGSPGERERRYRSAAQSYEKAGDTAPDDAKKYEAYVLAGQHYELARSANYENKELPNAVVLAYEKATKVTAVSGEKRANAMNRMADAMRIRDWMKLSMPQRTPALGDKLRAMYEAVLKLPGADKAARKHAQSYIGYLWSEQGEHLKAALAMEELSKWPDATDYDQEQALSSVDFVLREKKNPPADPLTVQLLDRVYPRRIKLAAKPEVQAALRISWAKQLADYGNPARAAAVREALAADEQAPHENRAQAIELLAAQRVAEKQAPLAIKAWERTANWPPPPAPLPGKDNSTFLNWAHRRAASLADAYFSMGDEKNVRAQFTTMAGIVKERPPLLWYTRLQLGASYQREADALRKANAQPSAAVLAQITAQQASAATEFEAVIAAAEADPETRYNAGLQRAQIEADQKQYEKARGWLVLTSEKLKAKDVLFSPKSPYVVPLMKAAARAGYAEKNYAAATDALLSGLSYYQKPDDEGIKMVLQLWAASRHDKQWEQARHILARMKANGLPLAEYYSSGASLEAEAQSWKAAADFVVLAEKQTLSADQKKAVDDAVAKIPADILKTARDAASAQAASAPAPATPPATSGGGGFWWF